MKQENFDKAIKLNKEIDKFRKKLDKLSEIESISGFIEVSFVKNQVYVLQIDQNIFENSINVFTALLRVTIEKELAKLEAEFDSL